VKAVIIGCGRTGANVARELARDGWEVAVVDEREEALTRLGSGWRGQFVLGHGMDSEILHRAGIEDADAVVVSTDGDNTNLVIAQVAQQRYGVGCVVVRVLDPLRAEFYGQRGLRVFCPTQTAISALTDAARSCAADATPAG
jgi:trk system potassium uptake protein TrkA